MEVLQVSELVDFKPGDVVFQEGDPGGKLFIIRRGEVEVVKQINGQPIVITRLGPDEIFGEMALLDGRHRSATVRAVSAVTCQVIGGDIFRRKLEEVPTWMRDLYGLVIDRLRATTRKYNPRAGELPGLQAIDFLSLLSLAEHPPDKGAVTLPWGPTLDRLIYIFDMAAEHLRAILDLLTESTLADYDFDPQEGRRLVIHDPLALAEFARFCRVGDRDEFASTVHGDDDLASEYGFLVMLYKVVGGGEGLLRIKRDELRQRLHTRLGQSLDSYDGEIKGLIEQGIWAESSGAEDLLEVDMDLCRERVRILQNEYEFPWLARKIATLSKAALDQSDSTGPLVNIENIIEKLTSD